MDARLLDLAGALGLGAGNMGRATATPRGLGPGTLVETWQGLRMGGRIMALRHAGKLEGDASCGKTGWRNLPAMAMEFLLQNSESKYQPETRSAFLWFMALAMAAMGCTHSPKHDRADQGEGKDFVPKVPAFLNGPIAVLLTNTVGFQGHLVMVTHLLSNTTEEVTTGEMVGRGTKLLFVPKETISANKKRNTGGISFLWDVADNSGFLLSESLQGYAPMGAPARFTNILHKQPFSVSAAEKIEGHLCQPKEIMVSSAAGSTTDFQFWEAPELGGFPLRIVSADNPTLLTLRFSDLRMQQQPIDAFLPPGGFTKYESAEDLMKELMLRQRGTLRRGGEWTGSNERGGGSGRHHSRGIQ